MHRDTGTYDPSDAIRAAMLADPRVRAVELIGSRATGTATELSDWDYRVTSVDPAAIARKLPELVANLQPLAQLWDPLASTPVYMILLPGAVKADLFPGGPNRPAPTGEKSTTPSKLRDVDAHFWDWNLWLGAKRLRGQNDLVNAELGKMWHHLLRSLGATGPPVTQWAAISVYLRLRDERERQLGCSGSPGLGNAVMERLQAAGLMLQEPQSAVAPGQIAVPGPFGDLGRVDAAVEPCGQTCVAEVVEPPG
jgi:hypothetical protein